MQCIKEVLVRIPEGLHHQAATRFIQTANRFDSAIRITYGDHSVNAKSLLGVLSLSIGSGAELTLSAEGADAEAALATLEQALTES